MILKYLTENQRQAIGTLALFGVTSALIIPDSLKVFTEAHRIIFTDSSEFKNIAELLDIDISTLRKNVFAYLETQGIECIGKNIH
jgi:hypothetical protein